MYNVIFFSTIVVHQLVMMKYLWDKDREEKTIEQDDSSKKVIDFLRKEVETLENENADLRVYKRLWQSLSENENSYKD